MILVLWEIKWTIKPWNRRIYECFLFETYRLLYLIFFYHHYNVDFCQYKITEKKWKETSIPTLQTLWTRSGYVGRTLENHWVTHTSGGRRTYWTQVRGTSIRWNILGRVGKCTCNRKVRLWAGGGGMSENRVNWKTGKWKLYQK